MNDTSYNIFRIQCRAIELTLALVEREYLRYPPGTIIDGVNVGGQFATGNKSGGTSAKPTSAPELDPESLIGTTVQFLKNAFDHDKTLEQKVTIATKEITKDINKAYNIPTLISDTEKPLLETIANAATSYKLIEEELPKAKGSRKLDLAINLVKTSILLAISVSLTVGAELAIGLFLGQAVGEILFGSVVALGIGVGVDKGLDLAKVDNPIIRGMTQLAVGVATGGIIAKVATQIAKAKSLTETAKQFIEQASSNSGIRSKVGDVHKLITVLEKDKIDAQKILDALQREVAQDKRYGRIRGTLIRVPHSFSDRLQEYVNLSSASAKDITKSIEKNTEIGLEWRKGIIDAELKYGEILDKIDAVSMKDASSAKSEKIYQDFLATLKSGKVGDANTKAVDQAFVANFGRFFNFGKLPKNGDIFVAKGKREYKGVTIDIGERVAEVSSATKEAVGLSNIKLGDVHIGLLEGEGNDAARGFAHTAYFVSGKSIFNFISVGFFLDARTLAFHEAGHLIENTTKLAKHSVDYIASRTLAEEGTQLIDGVESPITDFLHQYTGRVYGMPDKETATEVVSMGVEGLSSFQRIHRLVQEDIDHLRYTLFALEKTPT